MPLFLQSLFTVWPLFEGRLVPFSLLITSSEPSLADQTVLCFSFLVY